MSRIKICGITCEADALHAAFSGADAVGFVFADSPRRVSPEVAAGICRRLPPFVDTVGVFVDADPETVERIQRRCRLTTLQFHGNESDEYCARFRDCCKIIKAFRVKGPETIRQAQAYAQADAILLDAYMPGVPGGTGTSFDYRLITGAAFSVPLIISGGLTVENIVEVIERWHPYGVDVSSGVELSAGKKDPALVARIIAMVRTRATATQGE